MKKTTLFTFLVLLTAIAATARAADLPFIFFTAPNVVSWQDHGDAPGGGCNTGGTNHFAPDQFFILNATGSMNPTGGAGYAYPSSDTIVYSSTSVPHEYAKDSSATLEDLGLTLPGGVSTSIQLSEGEWAALCPSPYFAAAWTSAPTSTTGSLAGTLTILWPPDWAATGSTTQPFPSFVLHYAGDPITCSTAWPCYTTINWTTNVDSSTLSHQIGPIAEGNRTNTGNTDFIVPAGLAGSCASGGGYNCQPRWAQGTLVGHFANASETPLGASSPVIGYVISNVATSTMASPTSTLSSSTYNATLQYGDYLPPRLPPENPYLDCVDTSTYLGFPTGVIHQNLCQTGVLFFTMTDDEQQSAQDYVSGTMSVVRQQPPFSLTQGPAAAIALIASTTATTSASLSVGATLAAPVINFVDPFGAGSVVLLFALGIIKVIHII